MLLINHGAHHRMPTLPNPDQPPCQHGYTLTEMLIALSITALVVTLIAPSFNHFIQQVRLTTAANDLHNAMNLARTEAIKRNGRVDLVARNGSWKNGWTIKANDHVIFSHEALHKDIQVDSTFQNKTKAYIAYHGTGRTRTDANVNTPLFGSIRLSIGDNSRLIVVNFLGRIRTCNPTTAAKGTCTSAALEE